MKFADAARIKLAAHFRCDGRRDQLARGGQCVTSVELLPLHAGLHSLTGVVVMDMQSAQEFHQPSLTDVFVQPASTTEMSTVDASASASTSTSTTAPATSSSTSSSSAFMVEATTPGDGAGPSDGGGLLNLGGFVGGTEGSGQTAADIFGGGEAGGDFDGLIMPSPPGAGAAADVAAPPPLPPFSPSMARAVGERLGTLYSESSRASDGPFFGRAG